MTRRASPSGTLKLLLCPLKRDKRPGVSKTGSQKKITENRQSRCGRLDPSSKYAGARVIPYQARHSNVKYFAKINSLFLNSQCRACTPPTKEKVSAEVQGSRPHTHSTVQDSESYFPQASAVPCLKGWHDLLLLIPWYSETNQPSRERACFLKPWHVVPLMSAPRATGP